MHPLEALGLERDADERAVKRAYAQRLKTTRPDEDPAGFQKLHETYQAALSFLRWRADNPDAKWWDEEDFDEEDEDEESEPEPEATPSGPTGMPAAEFEELIGNPRYAAAKPEPVPVAAPRPAPQVERVRDEPEPFRLDVRDFLRRLFEETDQDLDEHRLRAWLTRETADWPLVVKPRVAHDLFQHMLEERPSLTPEQLEVIVDQFGLDDVQTGIDPIGLEHLRQEADKRLRQRSAKFAHLFRPENRDELCRYMAQPERGSHPAFATRFVARLLTGPKAYEWAYFLRPVPFVNRFVMGFVRDLDQGRSDAVAPHIDGMALDFWLWAEMRREANRGLRWVVAIVGLLAALAYATKDAPNAPGSGYTKRPGRTVLQREDDQRRQQFADRIRRANAMELAKGLEEYDALMGELPPAPWGVAMEEVVALAHYNRAVILDELGRPDEARPGYESVDRLFQHSQSWPVQLVTARALVNLGHVFAKRGSYRESLPPYQKVVSRYGGSRSELLHLQVAKALNARAASFRYLGELDESRHALDDLLRRFGSVKEGELGGIVTKARERRAALDQQGAPPTPTLVPGEGTPPPAETPK